MTLALAKRLADAAACMDWMRRELKRTDSHPELTDEAAQHVDFLHGTAATLAGDRIDEVYAPDDTPASCTSTASGEHHEDPVAA